jgi:hypothetical protein
MIAHLSRVTFEVELLGPGTAVEHDALVALRSNYLSCFRNVTIEKLGRNKPSLQRRTFNSRTEADAAHLRSSGPSALWKR